MVGSCPKCGNYAWDKEVSGAAARCPKCGHRWPFLKLPVFLLSGCSGVGKTTTAQALMQRRPDFAVLDADFLYGIMNPQKPDEYRQWVEQLLRLAANVAQSGRPVLWAMAGCLDLFPAAYHRRFFSEIHCLALTCSEEALRRRMAESRGIADENWIRSSAEYNRYFLSHDSIGGLTFDTCDITDRTPDECAARVERWVKERWRAESEPLRPLRGPMP